MTAATAVVQFERPVSRDAQDELTSIVWGMPGSVVAEGLANHVMGLEQIGNKISSYLKVGA